MTKVYLVKEYTSYYDDSYERIVEAFFDKDNAVALKSELNTKLKLKLAKVESQYNNLKDHVRYCNGRNCYLCDTYYDLEEVLYEHISYSIKEIEVK